MRAKDQEKIGGVPYDDEGNDDYDDELMLMWVGVRISDASRGMD